MGKRKTQAAELFHAKYNCAQAVAAVFSEQYGLDRQVALRLSTPFGGGVRSGELCGALGGAAMVIGMKYGTGDDADSTAKHFCMEKTEEFMAAFKREYGAFTCRELKQPEAPDGGGGRAACALLVARTAELLEEMGY